MKYIWEEQDIKPGMWVQKPVEFSGKDNYGSQAKWTYMVSWKCGMEENEYSITAFSDGMICDKKTTMGIVNWLNEEEMMPASPEHIYKLLKWKTNQ